MHSTCAIINKATHEKEEELKQQLLMQVTAHRQHLLDALHAQAEQLGAKWACQTEGQLTQQETHYQNELVKALAGLRGIKSVVDSIVNAGIITDIPYGDTNMFCLISPPIRSSITYV